MKRHSVSREAKATENNAVSITGRGSHGAYHEREAAFLICRIHGCDGVIQSLRCAQRARFGIDSWKQAHQWNVRTRRRERPGRHEADRQFRGGAAITLIMNFLRNLELQIAVIVRLWADQRQRYSRHV